MTENVTWHGSSVNRKDRQAITGGEGMTVLLTGLSGSGKSTIAHLVEADLITRGRAAYVLDGDNLRHDLNSDLGFSEEDRSENVRRISSVARLFSDAGMVVLVAVIAPFAADRDRIRRDHESRNQKFLEVFVDAPLEVCEERDPKGLYAQARASEIARMTGLDSPYEEPVAPDLRLDSGHETQDSLAQALVAVVLAVPESAP